MYFKNILVYFSLRLAAVLVLNVLPHLSFRISQHIHFINYFQSFFALVWKVNSYRSLLEKSHPPNAKKLPFLRTTLKCYVTNYIERQTITKCHRAPWEENPKWNISSGGHCFHPSKLWNSSMKLKCVECLCPTNSLFN